MLQNAKYLLTYYCINIVCPMQSKELINELYVNKLGRERNCTNSDFNNVLFVFIRYISNANLST